MKTLKFVVVGMMLILAGALQGQLSVRVHVGTPPAWGPAGYSNVRYYYLPDVEAYYDVQTSMFIYMSGNRWVRRSYLPDRYRNYDLYNGYKVVMNDYHGNTPYTNFNDYRARYSKGYHGSPQRNIGERNYQNKNQVRPQPVVHQNRTVKHSNVRIITKKQEQRNDNGRGNNKIQQHGNDKRNGK